MIVMTTMPLGFLLWGWLADTLFAGWLQADGLLADSVGRVIGVGDGRGAALLIIGAGVFLLLWGLAAFRYAPLRDIEDRLPDAVPEGVIIHSLDELQARLDQQYATALD
jgi:hypothetical protein